MKIIYLLGFFLITFLVTLAQPDLQVIEDSLRMSPVKLPGKGLSQHDFFYAGENSTLSMYIIKNGKIDWSYTHPGKGEISDAVLLSNGDVLFARQFGITKISHDKKVLWNYDTPAGFEIHTAQPIGNDRVLFIQNGKPAKVMIVNIVSGKTEKEFEIPAAKPESVHGQFRHARLTNSGTLLVAHLDMNKIAEYDITGKELWSMPFENPWCITPLNNGNFLVCNEHKKTVVEMNRKGDTLWNCSPAYIPGYKLMGVQTAIRIDNGNTILNNWAAKANGTNVQAIEVNKNKKIIWALCSWAEPADLGKSTTIQVLDKKQFPENVRFGNIK